MPSPADPHPPSVTPRLTLGPLKPPPQTPPRPPVGPPSTPSPSPSLPPPHPPLPPQDRRGRANVSVGVSIDRRFRLSVRRPPLRIPFAVSPYVITKRVAPTRVAVGAVTSRRHRREVVECIESKIGPA